MSNENYFPINLPSKCLVYTDVDPSKILIRTFKGKDQELISQLTLANLNKKFLVVINNVIQGIEASKLTSGDGKYVLMWETINSYGNNYPLKMICEFCLQDIEISIDLNTLEKKELPDNFKQPYKVKLSDSVVKLRLLTLGDEVDSFEFGKKGQPTYLYDYALSIVDESMNILDKVEMLRNMDVKDLNKIESFHEQFDHGPDMETNYVCPKCGGEGKVLVPFRLSEFFRFRSRS